MNKRLTHKQLNIYVLEELHKEIKMKALDRNITMQEYIIQAVIRRLEQEKKYE